MRREEIQKLKELYKSTLTFGFPYEDILKMEKEFENQNPEIENFIEDFNDFCLLVAGSCTYVLSNKRIPKSQRKNVEKSFFSQYPQYHFIQSALCQYADLNREFQSFERARVLLVKIIHS